MKKKVAKVECVYINENREAIGFEKGQAISPVHPKELSDLPQFEEVSEPIKETKKKKSKEVD